MKVNSEAIYATRPMAPYMDGQVRFTRAKDGTVYAIYLPREGETALPREVAVGAWTPPAGATITLVGTGQTLAWKPSASGFTVEIPAGAQTPSADAWVMRIK
jgi:alpha-L-fucosidase